MILSKRCRVLGLIHPRLFCTAHKPEATSQKAEEKQHAANESTNPHALKLKILNYSLEVAKDIGFNDQALLKGCEHCNLSPAAVGMFGRGPYDLIDFAMDKWYDQFKSELDELELYKISLSDRIKAGVKLRLSYEIPYLRHWPSAMSVGLHPYFISNTMYKIHKVSDHVWFVAGDNSLDQSWYTKRAMLSTVYCSTELYMIQDKSKDLKDTWEFLNNRVNDLINVENTTWLGQQYFSSVAKGAVSLASMLIPQSKPSMEEYERYRKVYEEQDKKAQSGSNNTQAQSTDGKVNEVNQTTENK